MKGFIKATIAAALAAQSVSGHYIFQALSKGTAKGTPFEFVRRNTNYNSPVTGKFKHKHTLMLVQRSNVNL